VGCFGVSVVPCFIIVLVSKKEFFAEFRRMVVNKWKIALVALLVFLPTPSALGQEPAVPKKTNARPEAKPSQGAAEPFDKADTKTMAGQCVRLDTETGAIEMEMYPESAPESVRNFLNLAATGAFDTTTFSRVVPGFVIQGGDLYTRDSKMTVGLAARARRTIPDGPSKILHERGVVSMARSDEPNQATTNFFILLTSAPYLDGKFAAFGRVTKGMEVVEAINKMPVTEEKPEKPVRIRKATLSACPTPSQN
jgi:peptidyl-prolyl cis-trans isomerase B (cyclophilin B)